MLSLGGSTFLVGLDAFALTGPGWLLTLWGGLLADRYNRKYIILFFQFIQMLAVAGIILLMYTGILAPWMLIAASLISGITDSLSMPSLQTLVPSLVKKDDMPKAVSLNALQFNLSRMIGPAVAGFAMAKLGAISCFTGNLISYLPLFFAVTLVYPKKFQHRPLARMERDWRPRWSDFTSVLTHKDHFKLLASIFLNSLFVVPLMIFVPVLVKQVLHASSEHLGLVMGASGVGGLLGALGGMKMPEILRRDKNSILLAILAGVCLALLSWNRNIVVLGLGLMLIFTLTAMLMITSNSRIQMDSLDQHRGRAASFFQLAMQGGLAIGGLWTGALAQAVGIQQALLINGSAAILLQLGLYFGK